MDKKFAILGSNGAEVIFQKGVSGFAAFVAGQEGPFHLSDETSVAQMVNDLGKQMSNGVLEGLKASEVQGGISVVVYVQSLKKSALVAFPYSNDPNSRLLRLINMAIPGAGFKFATDFPTNDFAEKSTIANLGAMFGGQGVVFPSADLNQSRNIFGSVMGSGDAVHPMIIIPAGPQGAQDGRDLDVTGNVRTLTGEENKDAPKGGLRTL